MSTDSNDTRRLQRRLALFQIWTGGIITLGATAFAIGATMWVATWSFFPALKDKGNERSEERRVGKECRL